MSKNHAWESHRCGKVCVDDIIFSGWESAGRGNYNKVKGNAVSSHLCTLLFTFMNLGWLETHILQNKLFKSSQLTEPAPPVRTPAPVQWTVRPAATGHIYSNSRCVYSLSVLHSTLLSFTFGLRFAIWSHKTEYFWKSAQHIMQLWLWCTYMLSSSHKNKNLRNSDIQY